MEMPNTPQDGTYNLDQTTNKLLRERGAMLTVQEVATYLNIKPATVRALARDGKIQAAKINGRIWRFDAADVLEYIEKSKGVASENILPQ